MGGDWVAGVPLPGGRLGLVVGDIGGHGIDAVADMAQLRSRTTALLEAETSLVRVAELASQAVEGTDAHAGQCPVRRRRPGGHAPACSPPATSRRCCAAATTSR